MAEIQFFDQITNHRMTEYGSYCKMNGKTYEILQQFETNISGLRVIEWFGSQCNFKCDFIDTSPAHVVVDIKDKRRLQKIINQFEEYQAQGLRFYEDPKKTVKVMLAVKRRR